MYVHLTYARKPEGQKLLESLLDSRIVISTGDQFPVENPVEILVAGRPTAEQLASLPDLRVVIVPWTGIPPETLQAIRKFPDLKLHNLHHNAAPTAELALTLLLAAAKMLIPYDRGIRSGNWELRYAEPESMLLAGKRCLLMGYGEIGKRLKAALEALDMELRIVSRRPKTGVVGYSRERVLELLTDTDVLVLAVPYTEETEGLIGEEELGALPQGSLLVNISRGGVVDQKALYEALKSGRLFGAGLDVWYRYPEDVAARKSTSPGDYPFHELDNLVMSPHRAGHVRETEEMRVRGLAKLLNQAARGEPIDHPVDIDKGY